MIPVIFAAVALALAGMPSANAAPTVTVSATLSMVQKLVDNLLAVPQVKDAFKDGETLTVTGASRNGEAFMGTIEQGSARLRATSPHTAGGATHIFAIDSTAAISLANAFDPTNTAMLIIRGGHVGFSSQHIVTQGGFNALLKTPAKSGLEVYSMAAGRNVTYGGCSGTLAPSSTEGYFLVELCGSRYVVNELGGVNGRLPNKNLADNACSRFGGLASRCNGNQFLFSDISLTVVGACKAGLGPSPADPKLRIAHTEQYTQCLKQAGG